MFSNLKKRYLKKRSELKQSKKSWTSLDAVSKAEKNFHQYNFLSWLDEFIQIRPGRTNLQRSHDSSLNDCDIEADIENTADEQSHIEVEGDVNVEDSDIEDVATVS